MSEGMAGTTAGHNAAARADVIRSIKTDLDTVNSEIAELQERRKRIKERIKADLGMKVADFNVLCRFADLEQDARDELFDVLREGFKALSVGTQTSFLEVIGASDEKPAAFTEESAKALGAAAFAAGREQDDFDKGVRSKKLRLAWIAGWGEARDLKAAEEQAAKDDFTEGEPLEAAE